MTEAKTNIIKICMCQVMCQRNMDRGLLATCIIYNYDDALLTVEQRTDILTKETAFGEGALELKPYGEI